MYTKREAAEKLGIDRNTLDKWLLVCDIVPKRDPRDARLRLLSDDDLLTLREQYADSHRAFNGASVHPLVSSADLDELHAQIADLEQQVAALTAKRHNPNLTTGILPSGYEPSRRLTASTVRYSRTPARPPVPSHLMSLPMWVKLHGMKIGTAKTWREKGKVPMIRGQWIEGNSRIDTALTREGREIAHQLAGIPWPCELCAAVEAVEADATDNETPHPSDE